MVKKLQEHVFAGCKFPGRHRIGEILVELERQQKCRKDLVIASDKLRMRVCDGEFLLIVPVPKREPLMVPLSNRAHVQLAQRVGLPMRTRLYYWLARGTQNPDGKNGVKQAKRNWDVWANLVNAYLEREKNNMLVRLLDTADGHTYCRALLSDQYKIVPNSDFFYAIVDKVKEAGAEIWHARLSEDKFYGYAVAPHISGKVSTDRSFDPGDGWRSRWHGKEGDVLNAAMAFGNSETGEGGIFLSHAILRRVCENYCVWHDVMARTHIGKKQAADVMLSAETIAKQNEVFFMKVGDYVKGTFDAEVFQQMINQLDGATHDEVRDPEQAANALQLVYDLGEERKAAIRNMFIRDMDNSRYGLINAVTRYAHEHEADPDKGFDLEKLARDLAYSDMDSLYKKAAKVEKSTKQEAFAVAAVGSGNELDDLLP